MGARHDEAPAQTGTSVRIVMTRTMITADDREHGHAYLYRPGVFESFPISTYISNGKTAESPPWTVGPRYRRGRACCGRSWLEQLHLGFGPDRPHALPCRPPGQARPSIREVVG